MRQKGRLGIVVITGDATSREIHKATFEIGEHSRLCTAAVKAPFI
jgi:hypothetical protein